MPAIRGITIAVGEWYASTLDICLWRNMRHFAECLVVTAPGDPCALVARKVPGVRVLETDAFTRPGSNGVVPRFNKGMSMEEGLDAMGRRGWIAIHDADILLPDSVPLHEFKSGYLNGCRRRILDDPKQWRPGLDWRTCPPSHDGGPIGFFQCVDADGDRHLPDTRPDPATGLKRPWYDVSFTHAGGGDAAFMRHWPRERLRVLPFEVLHLGRVDSNWFGADQAGRDLMAAYVHRNGWRRAMAKSDPTAQYRVGEIVERVEVPGYEVSTFELPFVARAKAMKAGRPG